SRWQEALAAFVGAASLLLLGLYLVGYGLDFLQGILLLPSSTPDLFTLHSWLVYSSMIAIAGAVVCAFSGTLAAYNIVRQTAQPALHRVHALSFKLTDDVGEQLSVPFLLASPQPDLLYPPPESIAILQIGRAHV